MRDAGPGATVLMLVLMLLFWGLSHTLVASELSSAVPEEGGFIRWIEMSFGRFWSFQAAWWYWIKMLADTSIYPILFSEYLKYWFHDLTPWQVRAVRVSLIWVFVGVNLLGIRTGGRLAVLLTLFILTPFGIFVALGLPYFKPQTLLPLVAEGRGLLEGLGLALVMGMWCYNTLDSVSVVSGEVRNPTRAYARAYAVAIPCIFLVYILPVLAGLGVDPNYAGWADRHFTNLGRMAGGGWLGAWIALGMLGANISIFHGALMINTRVPMVLAAQGQFPASFASLGARSGAPWVSLLFDGAVYTVVALSVDHFIDIVVYNQVLNACIYTLLYLSFLLLRARRPDLPRLFRVPGGWPGALLVCAGPFIVCWIGVPTAAWEFIGARRWEPVGAALLAVFSAPLAWWFLARQPGRGGNSAGRSPAR